MKPLTHTYKQTSMDPETGNYSDSFLARNANGRSSKDYSRWKSHPRDELQGFRTSLKWLGLDQSSIPSIIGSLLLFILFTIVIPIVTIFATSCDSCSARHQRPYNNVVQISQSVVATIAFFCLTKFVKKYGLRRFLFLDVLCDESVRVSTGYTSELNTAFHLLSWFLLPCLVVDAGLKAWWYASETVELPFIKERYIANTLMCLGEILARMYRTGVFFLVCVLFRLACSLQILRFQDFMRSFRDFEAGSQQVTSILKDHLRIKHQLWVISHRFRFFIVAELICTTFSQFVILFLTTEPRSRVNIFTAFDLAINSVVFMTGVVIVLQSATKITHKALGVKVVASRWHALATCRSDDEEESNSSTSEKKEEQQDEGSTNDEGVSAVSENNNNNEVDFSIVPHLLSAIDGDYESSEEDSQEDIMACFTIFCKTQIASFQKRQALVKYLEHNNAAITVFGFVLDRSSLHMIFGVELSLALFILGKTISISA